MKKSLVVIGGGAAGFFCAVNAARLNPELEVTILEKSNKLLAKVKISGGGRCNITHACFNITEMAGRYPRGGNFVKKIYHQFFTKDTINWFEERGVLLKTEEDGRMFPVTDSSQTIIDCLLNEATSNGVQIKMQCEVKTIKKNEVHFEIVNAVGQTFLADYICIACGGFPKAAMFDWILNTGHTITDPVPSLFTFNSPKHPITKLMGVSVPHAKVAIVGTKLQQQGPVLITHWGISGPGVLRLSAWAAQELAKKNWEFTACINWLPKKNEFTLREEFQQLRVEKASHKIHSKNTFNLPQRLWEYILTESGITDLMRWAELPAKNQNKLIALLTNFQLPIKGKTTYKDEFVTAGGINLSEIDFRTMMSKKLEHLFFAGEVLNIDGITGGYNFQNAWSTGYIAAHSISDMSHKPDK